VGKPLVGKINFFVSHAWSYKFHELVEAIESFEQRKPGSYYFVDYFAINQWEPAGGLESLRSVIRGSDALVLVVSPLEQPKLMTRAWCLYELNIALQSNIPIYATVPGDEDFWLRAQIPIRARLHEKLTHLKVDSKNSEATMKSDEHKIKTRIYWLSNGFECLDQKLSEAMSSCIRILISPIVWQEWIKILGKLLSPCFDSLIGGEVVYISTIILKYIGHPFQCTCSIDYRKKYFEHYLSCAFCKRNGSEYYCLKCKSSFAADIVSIHVRSQGLYRYCECPTCNKQYIVEVPSFV